MIGAILDLILGPLGAIIGGALAVLAAYWGGKSAGRKGAENDAMRNTIEREKAGRDAVRDGRASGDTPADRLRQNDGDWRGL